MTTNINNKLATGLERVANGELQIVFTANADAAAFESKAERDKVVRATFASVHGIDANTARAQANRACVFWSVAAAFQRIEDDHTSTFLQDGNRTVTTGKALGDALKAARQQALADLQALHPEADLKLADMPSTSGENYAWASHVAKLADEGSPAEILRMFQRETVAKFLQERAETFMRKPGNAIARAEADKAEAERAEAEKAMAAEAEKARTAEAEKVKAEAEAAKAEAEAAKAEAEKAKAEAKAEAEKAKADDASDDDASNNKPGLAERAAQNAPANPNKPATDELAEAMAAGDAKRLKHGKPEPMTRSSAAGAPSAAPSNRPDAGDEKPFPNVEVAKREAALVIGKALAAGVSDTDLIAMIRVQRKAQEQASKPDAAPQGKAKGKGGVSVAKGVTVNNLQALGEALGG